MRSVTLKLTLGFLIVSLAEAVLVALFARQATEREFDQFMQERALYSFMSRAANYYQLNDSWENAPQWFGGSRASQDSSRSGRRRWLPFALADQSGHVVIPTGSYQAGDSVPDSTLKQGTPLMVEDQAVGTVIRSGENQLLSRRELRYLDRTYRVLLYALVGALAISLLLGWFFARTYTRPLLQLTAATSVVAQGQLKQPLPIRSKDELGALTAAFNQMSADLGEAIALRRQMTADIAHELRTPLTALSGYLEAMCDGVLQPTKARLDLMYDEAQHLSRLVQDLRTLSLADAGELSLQQQPVAPLALLKKTAAAFAHQADAKSIELQVHAASPLPDCYVDPVRMEQVLGNLVDNALQHTPKNGQIKLTAQAHSGEVSLQVQDTGPGIAAEELPRIFARFYRIDASRQRQEGSSGLGLAISKSMVEIHGGRIEVESEPGRGTTFAVFLPTT
jgi:signal transduction histidine kinase